MTTVVRSILFVSGDSERKIGKSRGSNAEALVLNLDDSELLPVSRTPG